MKKLEKIDIDLVPIATVISDNMLKVPSFQRSYAWEEKHVNDLIADINTSMQSNAEEYFLGSLVLSEPDDKNERFDIIDGQQRLATISMLISSIRDCLRDELNDSETSQSIESDFLFKKIRRSLETQAHLVLNGIDHDFFLSCVLKGDESFETYERESHERIATAYQLTKQYVEDLTKHNTEPRDILLELLEYLENNVKAILVIVPSHSNAFTIFETLNDRGKDLTLADLLKNYLFGISGARLDEVKENWSRMIGILEGEEGEAAILDFLRYFWSAKYSSVRERDLYDAFKDKISTSQESVSLSKDLFKYAEIYARLLNPSHSYWSSDVGFDVSESLRNIHYLRMKQVRPLLLAAAEAFEPSELSKTFKLVVSWGVRFMIVGGVGGGTLESQYSKLAVKITSGSIQNTSDLKADSISSFVPSDSSFQAAFETARISRNYIARYYLASLEKTKRGEDDPEFVPNTNARQLNLEHVMPKTLNNDWPIVEEEHKAMKNRLGNMALLRSRLNSSIGNSGFENKKPHYEQSELILTSEISGYDSWGKDEIEDRQKSLAALAIDTWPI